MCVLHEPLLHIDAEPESVDAERDDGEEEPLYVVAEKLSARAIEYQPMSVNESVLGNPFSFIQIAHGAPIPSVMKQSRDCRMLMPMSPRRPPVNFDSINLPPYKD